MKRRGRDGIADERRDIINDNIMDKNNNNITDDITLTAEELKAAASTPIFYTLAQTAAIGREAFSEHRCDITEKAQRTAQGIADGLNALADSPTEEHKGKLIEALATALHIVGMAARHGADIPEPERYAVDYTAKHMADLFTTAALAIVVAHGEGQEEHRDSIALLCFEVKDVIKNATEHTPIRHEDAEVVTIAIDALNRAITNG